MYSGAVIYMARRIGSAYLCVQVDNVPQLRHHKDCEPKRGAKTRCLMTPHISKQSIVTAYDSQSHTQSSKVCGSTLL